MEKAKSKKTEELKVENKKPKNESKATSEAEQLPARKQSLKKWWIMVVLGMIAAVSLLGYLGYKNLVLAWVDNTPLTKFNLYNTLEKRYGKDYTDRLITETLILNEAKNRNVEAADTDLDAEIKKIEDQEGGADKLDQALITQKMTRDDLKSQLKFRILVEKMFGKDVVISDEEIDNFVEKNKAQYPEFENPQSSEAARLRQQVADNLKSDKVSKSFNEWLTTALESSRIKRLI